MKLIDKNVVCVEDFDDALSVEMWLLLNTNMGEQHYTTDSWVHTVVPGTLILTVGGKNQGMYTLNITMNEDAKSSEKSVNMLTEKTVKILKEKSVKMLTGKKGIKNNVKTSK